MMSPEECAAYYTVARKVTVPGDIVECGVFNGDSLEAISAALPGRRIWGYDSFQGFPAGNPDKDDAVALGLEGAVVGSLSVVEDKLRGRDITLRAGWFKNTFLLPSPASIAFLSVDCDLYDSVLLTLRTFAHCVVPGGIITLDDWTCFEGCRAAFYEWAHETGQFPLLVTFGTGQAYFRV